jgi:TP901 family phage tail tape measure protein
MIEIKHILDDSYRSVSEFQALGIDTTFQESALAIGYFGEKLIGSTEAAKKFRMEAIGAFVPFQDQLAYLTTLSAAAEVGQEKLGDSILNLVNGPLKNSVSAMEAVSSYYDAVSSGQSSLDFLNASMKFTAATGASAADSVGALAQVHNIYKLNARDATRTAALFNSTIENGVINGAQMASGIGQLATVASAAGIDLVELNAMLAALTKNGFSATDAFQGLMSLITSIAGQGAESAKAAQELGIRFDFARVKAEGLVKPINELYAATNSSESRIKTVIPDALAFRTAIALATSASQDFVNIQGQMENLDSSSLDVVFQRRQDSIAQRTEGLKEGFRNEMIRFGQQMQETMEPVIGAAEHLLERIRNLPEPLRDLVVLSGQVAIVLDKVTQTGSVLLKTLGGLAKAYLTMRVASLVMTNSGREQIGTIIDLIKNQKDYIGALKTFLGVSDNVAARIKHLTGIEKSQLLSNKKLLTQRQAAIKELSKVEAIGGVNIFTQSPVKEECQQSFCYGYSSG